MLRIAMLVRFFPDCFFKETFLIELTPSHGPVEGTCQCILTPELGRTSAGLIGKPGAVGLQGVDPMQASRGLCPE